MGLAVRHPLVVEEGTSIEGLAAVLNRREREKTDINVWSEKVVAYIVSSTKGMKKKKKKLAIKENERKL